MRTLVVGMVVGMFVGIFLVDVITETRPQVVGGREDAGILEDPVDGHQHAARLPGLAFARQQRGEQRVDLPVELPAFLHDGLRDDQLARHLLDALAQRREISLLVPDLSQQLLMLAQQRHQPRRRLGQRQAGRGRFRSRR